MSIEYLSEARHSDFIDFCRKCRNEVDDSYLYEEDLKIFQSDQDNPTYIVLDDQSKIIAGVFSSRIHILRKEKRDAGGSFTP
ncbi:hypothetical protein QNH10_08525 [Sporosarcina thermotolerans]|uniref:hypothetical protein n=1 Tax=Sporosarcina thermotolerans TaxID=633404 RepID=UPI0024BCC77B|nr:hypothetical protein [Sporosarcina thermotolerans]WHT49537.1 hypothetical protein QNH10_08525 [Sporosarcina thermotolerans]